MTSGRRCNFGRQFVFSIAQDNPSNILPFRINRMQFSLSPICTTIEETCCALQIMKGCFNL